MYLCRVGVRDDIHEYHLDMQVGDEHEICGGVIVISLLTQFL